MRLVHAVACGLAVVSLAGCCKVRIPEPEVAKKDYWRQTDGPALRKITDPARLPDFRAAWPADRSALLRACDFSLSYLAKPSAKEKFPIQGLPEITHQLAYESTQAFRNVVATSTNAEEFHSTIISDFDVYESVGCDDQGTVLFTGYYTPIVAGSLTQTPEYQYPLYKMPPDLVKDAEGNGYRVMPDGSHTFYYSRAEIDRGVLKGNELVWLKTRWDAYVCTVQGSAHIRLPDGRIYKIGYAANNGREYTSVALALRDDKVIRPEQMTLTGLRNFFTEKPEMLDLYLPRNERYVFFQPTESEPTGSINVPVTPWHSIATDKSLFPRACAAIVVTKVPVANGGGALQTPFSGMFLDQDSGGAIRAAGRADLYIGIGDEAGRIAGWTFSEGRLCYLFLKSGAPIK